MAERLGYVVATTAPGMTPDPSMWFQKSPGGPWYKINRGRAAYYIRPCERCGREALMERNGRFCSKVCAKREDDPSYDARHRRVKTYRGSASSHTCTDCGGPAHDWSQIHGTSGDEPEHYEPRCRKCHALYDLGTRFRRGERHPNSKLSDAQRRSIRASTGVNRAVLARRFGVSVATIKKIRRGRELTNG